MTHTHNNSNPVSNQAHLTPPHVTVVKKKSSYILKSWFPFIVVGIIAIIFVICIHYLGGSTLFPIAIKLYADLVPIIHRGSLEAFPYTINSNKSFEYSYAINLPLNDSNEMEYLHAFDQLLESYPTEHESLYKNCWLENPTQDQPCFYDQSWLSSTCNKTNSYGYSMQNEEYNPCFILKFKDTGDWKPDAPFYHILFDPTSGYVSSDLDHGFIPVVCTAQVKMETVSPVIEIYPPKGFSRLYFPVSSFNATYYLPPLVAVKVKGLQRNTTVIIECAIVTPNAFVLWNNGRVSLTFSSL